MASISKSNGTFSVRAHVGDAKTLLAFNIDKAEAQDLAGFTIFCKPKRDEGFYLQNTLQFERPADHAQDTSLPPNSSINAPLHKFRWLHVPGSVHHAENPFYGPYTYTVTPRYFNENGELQPLDRSKSVSVTVNVQPFVKGKLRLGFTRGFTQSQAFVHNFSKNAPLTPKDRDLVYDTSEEAGANTHGEEFTYLDEYKWMGLTVREQIFKLLNDVLADKSLRVDIFAYDLNEPDLINILLKLAKQGRIRIILDNAPLHATRKGQKAKSGKAKGPTWEDKFTAAFKKAAKNNAEILRAHFQRYSHDKVFVVSKGGKGKKVLTGSTNFSVTGMYVNSNHILVFDDPAVAQTYYKLFEAVWADGATKKAFVASPFANKSYSFKSPGVPRTEITFSPHSKTYALEVLKGIATRVGHEGKRGKAPGSVLFAVMQLDGSDSTVFKALAKIHANTRVFSFGISDTTKGIKLYKPGTRQGILVTGKPTSTVLPPPFDQVPNIGGVGHQVHHKFVVCGFNGNDPVVYCGSSNLASGGEQANGDNLLAIHDPDVATAFAIEAVGLVDHFNFLDKYATKAASAGKGSKKSAPRRRKPVSKTQAAVAAKWFLGTDDKWTASYFNRRDLHYADRELFA
ncbi:MAG TPA: phospholipase D-like domain-containing protein [Beijerinckiaceae bacterium]|nr:phospholipase D-like domain-containing protein [Beijerinckiaceae bacterium]